MITIKGKRVLILEDDDTRIQNFKKNLDGNDFKIEKEASKCIEHLVKEVWDVLFLDHDLGGQAYVDSNDPNTGYQVAKFLRINPKYKPEIIIIHSLNPIGAENMQKELPEAYRIAFAWLKINQ